MNGRFFYTRVHIQIRCLIVFPFGHFLKEDNLTTFRFIEVFSITVNDRLMWTFFDFS